MQSVRIYYRRPPAREDTFVQTLVARTPEVVVTYMEKSLVPRPVRVGGNVVLEHDAPAIWFTFPGRWYDIGRFHLADGSFTGIYTNILTPVRFRDAASWETTDLFLDHWLDPDGGAKILDEDEFEAAVAAGWIDEELERIARAEIERIQESAAAGVWPPRVVEDWTLERVKEVVAAKS